MRSRRRVSLLDRLPNQVARIRRPASELLENRCLLAPLFLAPTTIPFGLVGRDYNFTVAAYGPDATSDGPYKYTPSADNVDGVDIATDGNALRMSGTPSTTGQFTFTVDVSDKTDDSNKGSQTYTLTVAQPEVSGINLVIDDADSPLPSGTAGVPYRAVLNAAGGDNEYTYDLPASVDGLTLFPYLNTVTISGTPQTAGEFPLTINTRDSTGQTGTQSFSLSVGMGLVPGMLPSPGDALAPGLVGQPYSQTITALGGIGAISFTHPPTVAGLSLVEENGALVLHGTPVKSGDFSFTISAHDSASEAVSHDYILHIATNPVTLDIITANNEVSTDPNSLTPAEVGQTYSQSFQIVGGSGDYTTVSYPSGTANGLAVSYDASSDSFTLSGTPTTAGSFGYLISATDSYGLSSTTQQYMLQVNADSTSFNLASNGTINLAGAPISLPGATENLPYFQSFIPLNTVGSYNLFVDEQTSQLPAGVSFTSDTNVACGILSGTPTEAGTFPLVLTLENDGTSVTTTYLLTVAPITSLELTRQDIQPGMQGFGYTQQLISNAEGAAPPVGLWYVTLPYQLSASGGSDDDYQYTATGLPPGMTLTADGQFGGTPAVPGDFSVAVTVTDQVGESAQQTYALPVTISPALGDTNSSNLSADFPGVAYQPSTAATAYGYNNIILSGGIIGTGKGQTIALIENSDQASIVSSIPGLTLDRPDQVSYADSDLAAFNAAEGLPQFGQTAGGDAPVFVKLTSTGDTDYPLNITTDGEGNPVIGQNGEFAEDVMTVHSLAPEANIVVFIAPPGATDDELATIYQTAMSFPFNLPDLPAATRKLLEALPPVSVVSSSVYASFNEYLDEVTQENEYLPPFPHTQPASVVIAAGDTGYFPPNLTGPEYPGNSANVISAAMTQPSIASNGQLLNEIGVSDAGGGPSLYLPQPSWQNGVDDYDSTTNRVAPDVGMLGSFNAGMAFFIEGEWQQGDGSSNAAPAWGALMAIVDQGRALLGEPPLTTLQALPLLYSLPSSDFHKISQLDDGTDVPANYNDSAGLGSPVASRLVPGMDGGHETISGQLVDAGTGAGLAGWTVYLDADDSGTLVPGDDPATVTDSTGGYQFLVAPGTNYRVRVKPPDDTDLIQTSHDPADISFSPGADHSATGVNFVFSLPAVSITGRLDPASDSGLSDADGITFVTNPIFEGTTDPGATVEVSARRLGSSSSQILGTTTADGQGNWSLTSTTLADGRYTVSATATDPSTGVHKATVLLPNATEGLLTIDTQAPRIVTMSVSQRQGEIFVTFQDNLSGLAQPIALNTQNYVLLRGPRRRIERMTVTTSAPAAPNAPQVVVLRRANGRRLAQGSYGLEILSEGLEDVAGNPLAGNFGGVFPTGPAQSGIPFGANFRAGFSIRGRHATRPRPLPARYFFTSAQRAPRTRAAAVRQAATRIIGHEH